jgi:teichuronic acid biosynthesis glycosyltransferase TuaH
VKGDGLRVLDRYLIWIAGVSWDGIRGTDRCLATAMTRHARILWVDPPISPVTSNLLNRPTGRSLRPLLSEIDDRIMRLAPTALPGFSRPGVRVTTARLVRSQISWALRRIDVRPFAVVVTHIDAYLGYWGDDVIDVLYGTDDYVAGAELLGQSTGYLRRKELRALARADVVAAVSPELARRWADLGANPVVIPNGCLPASVSTQTIPPELRCMPRPVVGLVGQLSDRIDLDVLYAVASAGFSLIIVGPLDPRWEKQRLKDLFARSNVHYAGPVHADAVPAYLAAIDVGITPYRDSPFNRASFPLKTLEYLGAGIPVVSTDLPAARWLHDDLTKSGHGRDIDQILVLAGNNSEFVYAISRIVASGGHPTPGSHSSAMHLRDQTRADKCKEFAGRHTWTNRANAFAAAIGL